MAKWKQILATDVPAYNDAVKKLDVPAIVLSRPADAASVAAEPKQEEEDDNL